MLKILLFALVLMFSPFAQSQEHPTQKSVMIKNKSQQDKLGTHEFPLTVEIIPSKKAEEVAGNQEKQESEKLINDTLIARSTVALAVFTCLLFVFTAALWKATVKLGRDAKETSEKQFKQMEASLSCQRRVRCNA